MRNRYQSEYWKEFRQEALKYHGAWCRMCRSKERLCVHHKYYTSRPEILDQVEIICEDCHNTLHGGSPRGMGRLDKKIPKRQQDVNYWLQKWRVRHKRRGGGKIFTNTCL